MGEEFYVGVGGKRSEMRVDEEYGQRKGWDEENNAVDDYLGAKSRVVVWMGKWGLFRVAYGGCEWKKEAKRSCWWANGR